ncbi:MAG TPA: hypothetical protein VJN94_16325 [Candidatus Binataceae bacterium]|nr:hypothetical protein [Candidatus Binataceae bacterium]
MPASFSIRARRLIARVLLTGAYICPECGYTGRSENFDWQTRTTTAPHVRTLRFVYCPSCGVDLSGSGLTRQRRRMQ